MKRTVLLLFTMLFLIFSLAGCSKYSSHYHAVAHVHSNSPDSAMVSFYEFDGTEVFKLKCESGKTARIQYSGKLETGSLTVYYDCKGVKTELFSVHSGDEINAYSEEITAGTVYIIVETSEKCQNGVCSFEINYD
ncbi:MAG: hypothetical protein KBS76_03220 [Ruminococcus sp.]|nr:hypothetical protein [Candidatus Apopatosoma intestinale]